MSSTGTGSVSEITVDASKTTVDGDKNGNGASEIVACFRKADLRQLFSSLPAGRNTVTVTIEGNLVTGGSFTASLEMIVKSTGGGLAASISPNPLNPRAKLLFATTKPGALRVQMFDAQGRLVKTIADESSAASGYHDYTIDGRAASGSKLASGVYYVKVWSQARRLRGPDHHDHEVALRSIPVEGIDPEASRAGGARERSARFVLCWPPDSGPPPPTRGTRRCLEGGGAMDRMGGIARWTLAAALLGAALASTAGAQDRRPGGAYVLELNGVRVGILRAVSGGEPTGEVMTQIGAAPPFAKKHIGSMRYDDLVLELGPGLDPAAYAWVGGSWAGKSRDAKGAVLLCDYNMNVVSRHEFSGSIASTKLPALDAASKEPASLTVTIHPDLTKSVKGTGTVESALFAKGQRPWPSNMFRLEIQGLDCSRVKKIDAVTVSTGGKGTEISDLRITLAESSAQTWHAWLENFLVSGNSGDEQEKSGDIVFLGSDGLSEVARVHLGNLGITSFERVAAGASDAIRSVVVGLYAERAELEWKGGAGAATLNVRAFGR